MLCYFIYQMYSHLLVHDEQGKVKPLHKVGVQGLQQRGGANTHTINTNTTSASHSHSLASMPLLAAGNLPPA